MPLIALPHCVRATIRRVLPVLATAWFASLASAQGYSSYSNQSGVYPSSTAPQGAYGSQATGAAGQAANGAGGYGSSGYGASGYGANGGQAATGTSGTTSGVVRLQSNLPYGVQAPSQAASAPTGMQVPIQNPPPPYVPGEFELYVQSLTFPQQIRRLGADLMMSTPQASEGSPLVPPDYILMPGDELAISVWGSVDADLLTLVDRSGRISIPRVGSVMVSGVRYADLPALLTKNVQRYFRNFNLSVTLGQLRGMRVYVTGFVARPGAYSVSSLATLSAALIQAGGPTSAGSFRNIVLKRQGKEVSHFDLYDLLVSGNRNADLVLQADDVVHVEAVGAQVAMLGSVNQPAIVELKPNETIDSALRMVGGLSSIANASRLTIEPLRDRSEARVVEVSLPADLQHPLSRGDVVTAYSAVDTKLPTGRQNKRVVVEGEVIRPGAYLLPANSSIEDALTMAGGLTPSAFIFGTQFTRESVRQTQQVNYDKLVSQLELDLTRDSTSQRTVTADDAKARDAQATATARFIDKMRSIRPDGRVVMQLTPDSTTLPPMQIEDGDRLYVPSRPTSVGVFGSVFSAGSFVFSDGRAVGDYLAFSGGPTRGADKDSAFVIRANGSVVSNLPGSGWFSHGTLAGQPALPGDTIFVPEELNKTTSVQSAKDWTQILYQLGLGLAGFHSAGIL